MLLPGLIYSERGSYLAEDIGIENKQSLFLLLLAMFVRV
nr:hypothetical protein Q903MT_gene3299 [Picea sitchensis]